MRISDWSSDVCSADLGTHDKVPVFASLLSGRRLSAIGGQTEFASSYAAYETLSEEMKQRIEGLKVVHSVETSMRRAGIEPTDENLRYWRGIHDKAHPLVGPHLPGRTSLALGCHWRIGSESRRERGW